MTATNAAVPAAPLVVATGARCAYPGGAPLVLPDFSIAPGEHSLLLGPSGSGKTTLIHAIAGLQPLVAGSLMVSGVALGSLSTRERDAFRARTVGLVMQRLHLIGALDVRANLTLAARLSGRPVDAAHLDELAASLGVASLLDRRPRALSQGEAQRVAIARALVNRPLLILADEPTSALDDANCEAAVALLLREASRHRATLIVATHDARLRPHFGRVLHIAPSGGIA